MNGTELKTLRQSLFLSVAECAALHQVQERVYRYWEKGEWAIPDDVAARMLNLDEYADSIAQAETGLARRLRMFHDGPPCAVLVRFASDADLWAMESSAARVPAAVHAAGIDRTRRALTAEGYAVRVVTLDRAAYTEYRAGPGFTDTPENRTRWARTMTDPPTRAKKSAHPSGEENLTQASGE